MNFWDNIVIMEPPILRRSSHFHCVFCGTCLETYRQISCKVCLLPLNEDKDMIVTVSDIRKDIGFVKRTRLSLKSYYLRFARWCGW